MALLLPWAFVMVKVLILSFLVELLCSYQSIPATLCCSKELIVPNLTGIALLAGPVEPG